MCMLHHISTSMLHFPGVLHTRPPPARHVWFLARPQTEHGEKERYTNRARGSVHHHQEPVAVGPKKAKPTRARVPPPRPHSDAPSDRPKSPPVPAAAACRAARRTRDTPPPKPPVSAPDVGRAQQTPPLAGLRGRCYSSWSTVSSSEEAAPLPMSEAWSARNLSAMAACTAAPVGSTSSSIMKYGECPVCTDPSVSFRTPM